MDGARGARMLHRYNGDDIEEKTSAGEDRIWNEAGSENIGNGTVRHRVVDVVVVVIVVGVVADHVIIVDADCAHGGAQVKRR